MIGRWLKEIATPGARAALLTGRFVAFDTGTFPGWSADHGAGCLLGLPLKATGHWLAWESRGEQIFYRFNALCMKLSGSARGDYVGMMRGIFPNYTMGADSAEPENLCLVGAAKAGVLIRARILADEARRTLQNRPVSENAVVVG